MKKVLAIASGGGHWVQLLRLRPAFEGTNLAYCSTNEAYRPEVGGHAFHVVSDANIWEKRAMVKMFLQVTWMMIKMRPHVVVTTGAAPGLAALIVGRVLGAKTIWVDSIANSEELSGSGKYAGRVAHVWLTQWPHLSSENGPNHWGAVL